jgi:hypothetical protein
MGTTKYAHDLRNPSSFFTFLQFMVTFLLKISYVMSENLLLFNKAYDMKKACPTDHIRFICVLRKQQP